MRKDLRLEARKSCNFDQFKYFLLLLFIEKPRSFLDFYQNHLTLWPLTSSFQLIFSKPFNKYNPITFQCQTNAILLGFEVNASFYKGLNWCVSRKIWACTTYKQTDNNCSCHGFWMHFCTKNLGRAWVNIGQPFKGV